MRTARLLLRQFSSPAILILLVTATIYGLLGNQHDALVLLAIIIPSGLLTFFQEYRAEATIAKLERRLTPKAIVIRDGIEIGIGREQLRLGDLVRLTPGSVVPADLMLVDETNLMIDESVLTSEFTPRHKSPASDRELFMGTHVSSGSGSARVVRIGAATRYGELVAQLEGIEVQTSFEKGVRDFGLLVARAILVLVAFVFCGNLALQRPSFESLLFSLALAVGLTPQMLPVIISVCLSTGARRLAQEKVLVKRLDAIEDLGTMQLLCTDKTGTLTVGELRVERAVNSLGESSDAVLQLAAINATLQGSSANAIDEAIKASVLLTSLPTKSSEFNFDFQRRRVSVVLSDGNLICKGAFAELLALTSSVAGVNVNLVDAKQRLSALHLKLVREGYKVIAVATRPNSSELTTEQDLDFAGFVLISDPPKREAQQSLAALEKLGIELKLVTGDSVAAALHIAAQVGIDTNSFCRGDQIATSSALELKRIQVFAEVNPIQKSDLVARLRASGTVVGFLGDGINDAAALRASDVAISVDDAVDVAKSASSIVLLEMDLSVLADGVRIGRRTFENTMKYVKITMSASFGNVLSMALASFFLPFLPMLPTQILLLNFLSDLPALAISTDRVDAEDLGGARSWKLRGIGHFMVLFGLISTAFDLTLFFTAIGLFDASAEELRSSWFALSLMTEVIAVLVLRTRRGWWQSRPSKTLLAISILVVLFASSVPLLGVLQVVELPRIGLKFALTVLLIALGYAAVSEVMKRRTSLLR